MMDEQHLQNIAEIANNNTDEEWGAVLNRAPFEKLLGELEDRAKAILLTADIVRGEKDRWNW